MFSRLSSLALVLAFAGLAQAQERKLPIPVEVLENHEGPIPEPVFEKRYPMPVDPKWSKYEGHVLHCSWNNDTLCPMDMTKPHVLPCTISLQIWDITEDRSVTIIPAEETSKDHPQRWDGGNAAHEYKFRSIGYDMENKPSTSMWQIAPKEVVTGDKHK